MTDTSMQLRETTNLVPFNAADVLRQKALVQQVMRDVMHKDEHYGRIPGTDKDTLYKSGAEILKFTFRLAADYDVVQTDLPGGHREYRVTATIREIGSGSVIGQGVGMCSTMESKYRFRRGDAEDTGKPVPKAYWDAKNANQMAKAQELLGGKGLVAKKNKEGAWTIHKRSDDLVENPNIADTYNTCLKIGKKRADVDGTISATAASDIFAQDLEDLEANAEVYRDAHDPAPEAKQQPSTAPASKTGSPAAKQSGDTPQCPKCHTAESVITDKYAKDIPDGCTAWIHYGGPKGKPGKWKGCGHKWTVDGKPASGKMPTQLEKAWAVLDEAASISKEKVEEAWNDGTILPFWEHLSPDEQAQLQAHFESLMK